MKKFKNDLSSGEKYEDLIINLLIQSGFTFIRKSDKDNLIERKQFDLLMMKNNKEFRFEIKSDIFGYETENEITEFNFNSIQSGIMSTTAYYWITIYILENRITIYRVKDLKELIIKCIKGTDEYEYRRCKGGDGAMAKLILINHSLMKRYIKNRVDLYIQLPIFDIKNLLEYFIKEKPKYKKIINKLNKIILLDNQAVKK